MIDTCTRVGTYRACGRCGECEAALSASAETEIRKLFPAQPTYGQRVRIAYLPPREGALYIQDVSYDWNGREWLAEVGAPPEWPRRIRP